MASRERQLEAAMHRKLVTRRLRWFPRGITASKVDESLRWRCGAESVLSLMAEDGLAVKRDGLWYLVNHPRAVPQLRPPPPPPPRRTKER